MVADLKGFPVELIKPEMKCLSLFSAAFLGENDVMHLKLSGVTDCAMIDMDEIKLSEMTVTYRYTALACDCFEFIDFAYRVGLKFDAVISDQWSNQDERINIMYFKKLTSIAKQLLIIGCTKEYMKLDGMFYKRSDYNGGTFWRVVKL